jgi:hypothetical protein
MNAMRGGERASRRLLAQSVMASTFQLVRSVRDQQPSTTIRDQMGERQRLMAELARHLDAVEGAGSLAALRAAVAESDRTLEELIG